MLDQLSYAGKRVIVTGAASGIGQATAAIVGALGAEVHALDINRPTVETATFVETDMRDAGSIERAVQEVGGPIDALFNCAGIAGTNPGLDILLCNFCGTRHLIDQVIPNMSAGAAIGNVSSAAGLSWRQHLDAVLPLVMTESFDDARLWCEENVDGVGHVYGFSKRVLSCYTVLTAPRLVATGIRMNTISPGATATGMWAQFVDRMSEEALDDARGVSGRPAQPEEQARALVFLNSSAASYINGTDLLVDGGREAAKTLDAVHGA